MPLGLAGKRHSKTMRLQPVQELGYPLGAKLVPRDRQRPFHGFGETPISIQDDSYMLRDRASLHLCEQVAYIQAVEEAANQGYLT